MSKTVSLKHSRRNNMNKWTAYCNGELIRDYRCDLVPDIWRRGCRNVIRSRASETVILDGPAKTQAKCIAG